MDMTDAIATAVLMVMREPTSAMVSAAAAKAAEVGPGDFVAIWKAMIDAALEE
jgi:hypothetical protein